MNIQENISLKPYNTFGIDVTAQFFVEITGLLQLQKVLQLTAYPSKLIISGGSNILLTHDIDALVMFMNMKGISVVEEDETTVTIKVMAGENWHELVLWCMDQNYGGIENLSLIPGNAGTAPIQNIGAYGTELKDIFVSCEAMRIDNQELVEFTKEQCEFEYRDSIFKHKVKDKYIITSIKLQLTKENHQINTFYGSIEAELAKNDIKHPTIKDVSDAVIAIRQSKLPDPSEIGNSGSFFKNPIINRREFDTFHEKYPDAPYYEVNGDYFKIPAGWLIEQCGFKGQRFGDAGVHEKQALVLVNYGNAKGDEILELAENIQNKVKSEFNIQINPEVNIIG